MTYVDQIILWCMFIFIIGVIAVVWFSRILEEADKMSMKEDEIYCYASDIVSITQLKNEAKLAFIALSEGESEMEVQDYLDFEEYWSIRVKQLNIKT